MPVLSLSLGETSLHTDLCRFDLRLFYDSHNVIKESISGLRDILPDAIFKNISVIDKECDCTACIFWLYNASPLLYLHKTLVAASKLNSGRACSINAILHSGLYKLIYHLFLKMGFCIIKVMYFFHQCGVIAYKRAQNPIRFLSVFVRFNTMSAVRQICQHKIGFLVCAII